MFEHQKVREWMNATDEVVANRRHALDYYETGLGLADLRSTIDSDLLSDEAVLERMNEFFTMDVVRAIVKRERENFAAGPFHLAGFSPVEGMFFTGLILMKTTRALSVLMLLDPHKLAIKKKRSVGDARAINFAGTVSLSKILKGRALTVRPWSVEPFDDARDLKFDPPRVSALEPHTYHEGDCFWRSHEEEIEFLAADGPVLMLQSQMITGRAPVALEYDADSRKLLRAAAVSPEPTRLQMLSTIMRLFGRTDSYDTVLNLLEYPQHFVRWHAMRELLAMDSKRSLPHLLRMMENDPQPSVRRAARATVVAHFPNALSQLA